MKNQISSQEAFPQAEVYANIHKVHRDFDCKLYIDLFFLLLKNCTINSILL